MRHYQHPALTGRNRLTAWTEKSVWCFFRIFRSRFPFINLLGRLFVARVLLSFFIINKYMSIVMIEIRFVCSRMLGPICLWQEREHHIRNSNKNLSCNPGYRLVNAVELSLQSDHNTQLRTCIILFIFYLLSEHVHHHKKKTPLLFEELCSYNTLIRNYYALLFLPVPGQASRENLLVRQVLCTSRTSRAWQFHTPVLHMYSRFYWFLSFQ
jgi:hypothetical protein